MSCDEDSAVDSEKPFKRVRFSEESDTVFEYEPERNENNQNFPVEIEKDVSTELEQPRFSTEESKKKAVDFDNIKDAANSPTGFCDDKVLLFECNKQFTITDGTNEIESCVQSDDASPNYIVTDSPPIDQFDNNNSMADVNSLILETEHMTISPPDEAEDINEYSSGQVIKTIFLFILT